MKLTIDGQVVDARPGASILEASLEAGIYIPAICYHPELPPFSSCGPSKEIYRGDQKIRANADQRYDGCGLCVVTVETQEGAVLSCETPAQEGMVIHTNTEPLSLQRKKALARILRDHPRACLLCAQKEGCSREPCSTDVPKEERCCPLLGRCELEKVADFVGTPPELGKYKPLNLPVMDGEPLFKRDYNLCIGCTRCVRACNDLRGVEAIGYVVKDGSCVVGTLLGSRLTDAGCRFCGACVEVCPTGALTDNRNFTLADREDILLPCRAACPAAIDVPGYVRAVAGGESDEAVRIIRESVPFPSILGMVCHHPCEDLCRRAEVDEPIAICSIKRFASETGTIQAASPPPPDSGKRVAIIGAGPAGLTAAFYLRSKGHRVTVFEREAEPGGMLKYAIPDYRLPEAILRTELERVLTGVELKTSTALGVDFHLSDLEDAGFDAVFLSTGVGLSRKLEIPGIESPLVRWGIEFLKEVNTGGRPQLGESVVVVGGGNVAVDVALSCVRMGSCSVSLVCLECESEMPAFTKEVETAREEGIEIMNGWGPKEILLHDDRPVELCLRRCTQVFDEQGNFSPVFDDATTQTLPADSVVMAVGQDTDPSLLSSPGMSSHTPSGLFITEGTRTDRSGVFAGGDGVRGPSSVVEAVADGRRAAEEIDVFLGGDGMLATEKVHPAPPRMGKVEGFSQMKRTKMRCADPVDRMSSFDVIELGYSSEEAGREASRCLQCDLRLRMASVVLPPEKWIPLEPDTVAGVPEKEGVYQLADEKKKVLKITGTQNLKTSLEQEVEHGTGALFCFDEDPMYTKRESELIQQYLQKYGELPGGGEGELDDLF